MNDDQVKGRADQVKGTIKEKTGRVIGNPDLEDQGNGRQGLRQGAVDRRRCQGKGQGRDRQDLTRVRRSAARPNDVKE